MEAQQPNQPAGHNVSDVTKAKEHLAQILTDLKNFNLTDEIRGVVMHLNEAFGLLEIEANKFVTQVEKEVDKVPEEMVQPPSAPVVHIPVTDANATPSNPTEPAAV